MVVLKGAELVVLSDLQMVVKSAVMRAAMTASWLVDLLDTLLELSLETWKGQLLVGKSVDQMALWRAVLWVGL